MSVFRRYVLHRFWLPVVVLITIAVFIPRARAATSKMSRISRAAGVYGSGGAEPNEFGGNGFRWMKRRTALHEPVRGRRLTLTLFVDRPGIENEPLTAHIRIAGVPVQSIVLRRRGWLTPTYDLVDLLGESRWRSLPVVTVAFAITRDDPPGPGASDDWGLPGVGVGEVHWSGPSPR